MSPKTEYLAGNFDVAADSLSQAIQMPREAERNVVYEISESLVEG